MNGDIMSTFNQSTDKQIHSTQDSDGIDRKTETFLTDSFGSAAYGGDGWSPRVLSHKSELGSVWADCGIESEWQTLKSVVVHRPGREILISEDQINQFQFDRMPDLSKARAEHDSMVEMFEKNSVKVNYIDPRCEVTANQMYCADLFAMTPQGAILARPASTVRAGEERWVARTLADLGIPVIKILTGNATFEGADLMWIDSKNAVIGRGLRTNQEGINQITTVLSEHDITTHAYDMPCGTMHFMGMLRIVDKDLAVIWPHRTPHALVALLREKGFQVVPLPDLYEALSNKGFNFVVLGPRKIMMAADNPKSISFYTSLGIECITVSMHELKKANGGMGCLTGIVKREVTDQKKC